MGTMLQAAQAPMGKVPEALNITHPELIRSIHQKYLEAGAEVLYANTFAANPYKVQDCPYSSTQLIQAGVKLAKEAANSQAWVALDLGPIGEMLAPNGSLSFDTALRLLPADGTGWRRSRSGFGGAGNHDRFVGAESRSVGGEGKQPVCRCSAP